MESTPLDDGSEDDSDADANNDDESSMDEISQPLLTQDFPEGVDMNKVPH